MLINRSNLKLHVVPIIVTLLLTVPFLTWYLISCWLEGEWLGGGSLPALVLGTVAAVIIASEMLLWPRKILRRLRLFPAKYWMSFHIWLGLACFPLAIFHSGLHFGGWFTSVLMVLLFVTILSGIYGLILQNIIPKWMLKRLPSETITAVIDHVADLAVADADQLMIAACGPRETVMTVQIGADEIDRFRELFGEDSGIGVTRAIVIGAPRDAGRIRGRSLDTKAVSRQKEDARALWSAFDEIRPFLKDGVSKANLFSEPSRSEGWFKLLRHACSKDAERVIGPLERWVEQRRQFNIQRKVHSWLQGWLPVHIAVSVALSLLLLVHIVVALRYW